MTHFHKSSLVQGHLNSFRASNLNNLKVQTGKDRSENGEISFLLQIYFDAFNNMFFFGALITPRCSWRFVKLRSKKWQKSIELDCSAYTTDYRGTRGVNAVNIRSTITIFEIDIVQTRSSCLRKYVQNLLHEMLHAFFNIYVRHCPDCNNEALALGGTTGHGLPWLRVALQLERFCKQELDLSVDLGRALALAGEIYEIEGVPEQMLEKLGLDDEEVQSYKRPLRRRDEKPRQKEYSGFKEQSR